MGVILQVMEPAAMSLRGVHVLQESACPQGVCMSPRGVHVPLECACPPGVCMSPWSVHVPQGCVCPSGVCISFKSVHVPLECGCAQGCACPPGVWLCPSTLRCGTFCIVLAICATTNTMESSTSCSDGSNTRLPSLRQSCTWKKGREGVPPSVIWHTNTSMERVRRPRSRLPSNVQALLKKLVSF